MSEVEGITLSDLGNPLSICFVVAAIIAGAAWYNADKNAATLKGLDSDWSFAESWASNVTMGSAALLAVLGSSDVVAEVLGEDSNALSVVVVASAIAAGLVAIAPLLVKALIAEDESVTVAGVLLGSILTLTGAGFEAVVLTWNANAIMDGNGWFFVGSAVVALIAVYGYRSLKLIFGQTESTTAEDSDTIKGAQLIAEAIAASRGLEGEALSSRITELGNQITPASFRPKRRNSAVL